MQQTYAESRVASVRVMSRACSLVTHSSPGPYPTDPYYPVLHGVTGQSTAEESSPRAVWLSFESDSKGKRGLGHWSRAQTLL